MAFEKSLSDDVSHGIYAKCVCKSDIKVKTILVGFPGMGLAGAIAAQQISEELKLDTVGFVEGLAIPPVAVFLDGYLRHPYRIMGKKGLDMVIFIGESAVSSEAAYFISNAILDWAKEHGAEEIIILDGFAFLDPNDEAKVFLVAEPEIKEKAEKLKIPPLKSGYIKGFAGAMLNKTMTADIDGLAFLVGTRPDLPDPGSAASLIETVNNYKNLKVETDSLVKQQESIKRKLQELSMETQEMAATPPSESKKKRTFYT